MPRTASLFDVNVVSKCSFSQLTTQSTLPAFRGCAPRPLKRDRTPSYNKTQSRREKTKHAMSHMTHKKQALILIKTLIRN